jgi:cytochrome b
MKTYIWSLPTRIFHWLLVAGLVAAYILSDEEELLNYHSSVGYMVGLLIIFRIVWGFIGPKYSRFSDFPVGVNSLKTFVTNMKQSKNQSPGHNPAASVAMLGIILFSLMIVVSGIMLLASEGQGLFAFMQTGLSEDTLKETHEILVNIVIGLVILHLLGNLVDLLFNRKTGTLQSMFTGYKNIEGESIKLSSFQKAIAAVGILAALAIVPYSVTTQKITVESDNQEQKNQGDGEIQEDDD